jgi:SAM-dependent methyltransferase
VSNKIFSESNKEWDYSLSSNHMHHNFWIGGVLTVSNLSTGFHGLLKQWWEYYSKNHQLEVLLITENEQTKRELSELYKNWNIHTLDLYTELGDSESDIIVDICQPNEELWDHAKYDLIINQATLEHLYNPFEAMKNMCNSLQIGGHLITHTHAQNMPYHQYPRDYMRFMIDWWYDLPKYIKNIKLIELYEDERLMHVFSCYKKL